MQGDIFGGVFLKDFSNPLISFYMTVKNGQEVVSDAIESVLDQTYQNLELIVVDDGSDDDTVSVVKGFSKQDSRIKLIESGGVGRARALNVAVNNASGEYLLNLDADDYAHPRRAELQVKFLRESGEVFVASKSIFVFDVDKPEWVGLGSPDKCLESTSVNDSIAFQNSINHSSVCFSRELIYFFDGFYDEDRKAQIDYELWIRLALRGVKLNVVDGFFVAKRIHSSQSFENKKRIRYLLSALVLNFRAISALDKSFIYYFLAVIKFFYGSLPQSFRVFLRRMF